MSLRGNTWIYISILVCSAIILVPGVPYQGLLLTLVGGTTVLAASTQSFTLPITALMVAMLFESLASQSIRVAGLPITPGKMAALYLLGMHALTSVMKRQVLIPVTPIDSGLIAMFISVGIALTKSLLVYQAYNHIFGMVTLAFLMRIVMYRVEEEHIHDLFRFMGLALILVLAYSMFTLDASGTWRAALDETWDGRQAGGLGDANAWSTALLCTAPLVLAAWSHDKNPLFHTVGFGALTVLVILGVLQSYSRAGLIALGITLPILYWALPNRRRLIGGMLVLSLPVIPFVVSTSALTERLIALWNPDYEIELGHGSIRQRGELAKAALQLFLENPIRGVGVAMFPYEAAYITAGSAWKVVHNTYLNIAAEQGSIGILTHGYLAYTVVKCAAYSATRTLGSALYLSLGRAFVAWLAAFALLAATLNLETFGIVWFALGISLAIYNFQVVEEKKRELEDSPYTAKRMIA